MNVLQKQEQDENLVLSTGPNNGMEQIIANTLSNMTIEENAKNCKSVIS